MNVLIVEDNPDRIKIFRRNLAGSTVVHTDQPKKAIQLLRDKDWDVVCLDHDLHPDRPYEESGPGTGFEVAAWLSENPNRMPRHGVYLHTLNPVGAQNMKAVLPDAVVAPGLWNQITYQE